MALLENVGRVVFLSLSLSHSLRKSISVVTESIFSFEFYQPPPPNSLSFDCEHISVIAPLTGHTVAKKNHANIYMNRNTHTHIQLLIHVWVGPWRGSNCPFPRVCVSMCVSVQAVFASKSITLLENKPSQPVSMKIDKTSKPLQPVGVFLFFIIQSMLVNEPNHADQSQDGSFPEVSMRWSLPPHVDRTLWPASVLCVEVACDHNMLHEVSIK